MKTQLCRPNERFKGKQTEGEKKRRNKAFSFTNGTSKERQKFHSQLVCVGNLSYVFVFNFK